MALDPKPAIKPFKKLRKLIRKLDPQPTAEDVHHIRTYTRRIEATLAAIPDICGRNEQRVLRESEKVRRCAGKVRDMDVLTAYVQKLNVDGEPRCVVRLLEHLGSERNRHGRKLYRKAQQVQSSLRPALKQSANMLDDVLQDQRGSHAAGLARDAASDVLRLSAELRNPSRLGKNNLHPYRLKVKELRYVLQNAQPKADPRLVEALEKVKDEIGEWHDWEELVAITSELFVDNRHPGCKLVRELRAIAEKKFRQALATTERFQEKYFPSPSGKKNSGRTGVPRPILESAGRMAA